MEWNGNIITAQILHVFIVLHEVANFIFMSQRHRYLPAADIQNL